MHLPPRVRPCLSARCPHSPVVPSMGVSSLHLRGLQDPLPAQAVPATGGASGGLAAQPWVDSGLLKSRGEGGFASLGSHHVLGTTDRQHQ